MLISVNSRVRESYFLIKDWSLQIITVIFLHIQNRIIRFYISVFRPNEVDGVANSVDPDLTAPFGTV